MTNTDRQVALVLGGTNPHIELIEQLKSRGFFVVLVDYLDSPPAKNHADVHEQSSTMDLEAVVELARRYSATLVISACVDQANVTACYAAERLGLPRPYSFATAERITNKGEMKRAMLEHGIPTTRYIYLGQDDALPELDLDYPLMVKPADNCASSGVKKASNPAELKLYLAEAQSVSRTGRTVIEEVAEGVEVSAYCFIQDGRAHVIMVSERLSVIEGERQVLKCYATVTPPGISEKALRKIGAASEGIARAFGLDNTPLHVQAICDGDDIHIIEFAPRVGGGISYETIRDSTGFDIISATIDSYLGIRVEPKWHPLSACCSVNLIYGVPGTFDRLEGAEELLTDGTIESLHLHKTPGATIGDDRASAGRIAAFVVRAATKEAMCEKIARAMGRFEAYDPESRAIMRHDLYYKG